MLLLTFDTAASLCAACVWDTQAGERGRMSIDIGKGHAEALIGVLEQALGQAGVSYADLNAVAVAVGPGSFTGVRVGVATARGLALALGIPAIGVTTLEALALEARDAHPDKPVLAAIDGGRGQAHVARYAPSGGLEFGPAALPFDRAAKLIADELVVTGSAARMLAENAGVAALVASERATADIAYYARLAVRRDLSDPTLKTARPKPLYMREADAKPQSDFALPRKAAP